MDLNIKCKSLQILAWGSNSVDLTAENCQETEILNHFTEREVVQHFDVKRILAEIGQQECMDYFDLIENNQ